MSFAVKSSMATLAAVMVLSSACSTGHNGTPIPSLGPILRVTSSSQVTRPIDAYLPAAKDVQDYDEAMDFLTNKCMKPFGLSVKATVNLELEQTVAKNNTVTALYGFFDTAADVAKGYDRVRTDSSPGGDSPSISSIQQVQFGEGSNGQPAVTYDGKKIPAGGCQKVAIEELGSPEPEPFVNALPNGGPQVAESDPRLKKADLTWSKCMTLQGYHYNSPIEAYLDPKWIPQQGSTLSESESFKHSSKEVATAKADVFCKISTNYMGIIIALEAAYDDQYVAVMSGELSAYRSKLASLRARVADVIAASGNS